MNDLIVSLRARFGMPRRRASGGTVPALKADGDSVLAALSPGGRIADPGESEALDVAPMNDPWQQLLNAILSVEDAHQKAKHTILCEPHREQDVRAAVGQAGAADILTVQPSPYCPEGQLLVINEGSGRWVP